MVLAAGLVALLAGPWIARLVRAHKGSFPACMFHKYTGLHCPGCGGTRAVLALLDRDPARALANNPLFVLSLPLILLWFIGKVRGNPLIRYRPWMLVTAIILLTAFWILRNLPGFEYLAPVP